MEETKFVISRESIKDAIAAGKTPEDLVRETELSSVQKLYSAIRGLYEQKARAEKLIEALKKNRKKPVLAAPVEAGNQVADEEEKPQAVPVAEKPAQDITKPQNGAPENPASVNHSMPWYVKKNLRAAAEKGCVVDTDYFVGYGELLKEIPASKMYIPTMVLNTVRRLVECGTVPAVALEMVTWFEENLPGDHLLQKAPADIVLVATAEKPRSILFAKHVINVRERLGLPEAVALTKSYEVKNLLDDYETK